MWPFHSHCYVVAAASQNRYSARRRKPASTWHMPMHRQRSATLVKWYLKHTPLTNNIQTWMNHVKHIVTTATHGIEEPNLSKRQKYLEISRHPLSLDSREQCNEWTCDQHVTNVTKQDTFEPLSKAKCNTCTHRLAPPKPQRLRGDPSHWKSTQPFAVPRATVKGLCTANYGDIHYFSIEIALLHGSDTFTCEIHEKLM